MKRQHQSQLRELAREYNQSEDEIARLVQDMAPANPGGAGQQMLLGPAGITLVNIRTEEISAAGQSEKNSRETE